MPKAKDFWNLKSFGLRFETVRKPEINQTLYLKSKRDLRVSINGSSLYVSNFYGSQPSKGVS